MKKPETRRHAIPGHVIALSALAALAALFAYALYDRPPGRAATPERPRAAEISRADVDWATPAQQKVLGTGRLTAGEKRFEAAAATAPDYTLAQPVTRTVTHLGVSPHRAETPRPRAAHSAASYAGPSLATLPPPGD